MYLISREKVFLILGAFFSILLIFLFFILPTLEDMKVLRERIVKKRSELKAIEVLREEYIRTREELLVLEGSAIGGDEKAVLLSALERLLVSARIDKDSVTINSKLKILLPSISRNDIELNFERVSKKELQNLLASIKEYSSTLHLKRLHLKKRYDNPSLFDGTIQISVLEKGKDVF